MVVKLILDQINQYPLKRSKYIFGRISTKGRKSLRKLFRPQLVEFLPKLVEFLPKLVEKVYSKFFTKTISTKIGRISTKGRKSLRKLFRPLVEIQNQLVEFLPKLVEFLPKLEILVNIFIL